MKSFKSQTAQFIYSVLFSFDQLFKKNHSFSYETAPYCGHHHSGHHGYFTGSKYHEGDGGCYAKFLFGLFVIYKCTDETNWELFFNYKISSIVMYYSEFEGKEGWDDVGKKRFGYKGLLENYRLMRNAKAKGIKNRMKVSIGFSTITNF